MEYLVKPIHQKSVSRVQEINAFVNSYHRQHSSHRRTMNRVEHQQMIKIRKAQKLNEEKQEVKELKNVVISSEDQKDFEMGYIYNEIKNSSFRAARIKANKPLKKIVLKTEPHENYPSKENQAPNQIKEKYSNVSSFFRVKTRRLLKQSAINNISFMSNCSQSSKLKVPLSRQKSFHKPSQRLSKKPSRRVKVKSKTNIQDIADQIQELIHKNVRTINQSLVRLNIDPDPPKKQSPYEPITIHISDCILNYKPWENKVKATKQQGPVPIHIQRKKFSRRYTKNAYKLSADAIKNHLNNDQMKGEESEVASKSRIKESMQRVYDAVDQFRDKKESHTPISDCDLPPHQLSPKRQPKTVQQHPRLRTQIQFSSTLRQDSRTRFWESFSGDRFKIHM